MLLKEDGENVVLTVSISNPTPHIAFFIYLQIVHQSSGTNVLPVSPSFFFFITFCYMSLLLFY